MYLPDRYDAPSVATTPVTDLSEEQTAQIHLILTGMDGASTEEIYTSVLAAID